MSQVLYSDGNFMTLGGFIYTFNRADVVNCVSWSLEVEVDKQIIRVKQNATHILPPWTERLLLNHNTRILGTGRRRIQSGARDKA